MRSVLFTCANINQLKNALPVAKELGQRGLGSHLLALDPFYGQGVGEALAGEDLAAKVSWSVPDVASEDPPFPVRSSLEKLAIIRAWAQDGASPHLRHAALVAGTDGAPERVLLSRYRSAGRHTAILWDSLILHPPRLSVDVSDWRSMAWAARQWSRFYGRRTLLRIAALAGREAYVPGLAGHTPAEKLFTMGEFVTRAFRKQGVQAEIVSTGNPRLDRRRGSRMRSGCWEGSNCGPDGPARVLYLTGSFLWHGERYLDKCQRADLRTLCSVVPAADWELRIRVHPREALDHYREFTDLPGTEVSDPRSRSLDEDIADADVVVTAISTAAIEALAVDTPVAVYLERFPSQLASRSLGAHPDIPVCTDGQQLVCCLEQLAEEGQDAVRIAGDFSYEGEKDPETLIAEELVRTLRASA